MTKPSKALYVIHAVPRQTKPIDNGDALLNQRDKDRVRIFPSRWQAAWFARELNDLDRLTRRREWRYRVIPISQVPGHLMGLIPSDPKSTEEDDS